MVRVRAACVLEMGGMGGGDLGALAPLFVRGAWAEGGSCMVWASDAAVSCSVALTRGRMERTIPVI